jgi:hypothetical protein
MTQSLLLSNKTRLTFIFFLSWFIIALATKRCEADGQWFKRPFRGSTAPGMGVEWSNYTSCSKLDFFVRREQVHIIAYAISIAALIPALIIFNVYK